MRRVATGAGGSSPASRAGSCRSAAAADAPVNPAVPAAAAGGAAAGAAEATSGPPRGVAGDAAPAVAAEAGAAAASAEAARGAAEAGATAAVVPALQPSSLTRRRSVTSAAAQSAATIAASAIHSPDGAPPSALSGDEVTVAGICCSCSPPPSPGSPDVAVSPFTAPEPRFRSDAGRSAGDALTGRYEAGCRAGAPSVSATTRAGAVPPPADERPPHATRSARSPWRSSRAAPRREMPSSEAASERERGAPSRPARRPSSSRMGVGSVERQPRSRRTRFRRRRS